MRTTTAWSCSAGQGGANDTLDWVRREVNWLEIPLGAGAFSYNDKPCEIGYYPIEPAGEILRAAQFPRTVCQWHSDGFDLPEDSQRLRACLERRLAKPMPKPRPADPPNRAPERKASAVHEAAV